MNAFHDALEEFRTRISVMHMEETAHTVYRAVLIELDPDTEGNTHHESHAFMRYGRASLRAVRERLHERLMEVVGEHEAILDRMLEDPDDELYSATTAVLVSFRAVADLLGEEDSGDSDESSESDSSDTDMP